jgi:hypothetical protein
MWNGRHQAARLAAIARLETDAMQAVCWSRRQRRALGADAATIDVAERACRQRGREFAPVLRCLAEVLRARERVRQSDSSRA